MSEQTKQPTEAELLKQLVGLTVVLSPSVAMYFDDNQQYVLNAYPDVNGQVENKTSEFTDTKTVLRENWKLGPTLKNVKAGVLRVLDKKGNDVSTDFGGPEVLNRRKTPLIGESIPRIDETNQRDINLRKVLADIDEDKILQTIAASKAPYEVLQRFLQLELAGENPSYQSRQKIVDGITQMIKGTGAVGMAGKIEDGTEETVTTVRK